MAAPFSTFVRRRACPSYVPCALAERCCFATETPSRAWRRSRDAVPYSGVGGKWATPLPQSECTCNRFGALPFFFPSYLSNQHTHTVPTREMYDFWEEGRLRIVGDVMQRYGSVLREGDRIKLGMEGDPCDSYRGESPRGTVTTVLKDEDSGFVQFWTQLDDGRQTQLNNRDVEHVWEIAPEYIETFRAANQLPQNDSTSDIATSDAVSPSREATEAPSVVPTDAPSREATDAPSAVPTVPPSRGATDAPSAVPTDAQEPIPPQLPQASDMGAPDTPVLSPPIEDLIQQLGHRFGVLEQRVSAIDSMLKALQSTVATYQGVESHFQGLKQDMEKLSAEQDDLKASTGLALRSVSEDVVRVSEGEPADFTEEFVDRYDEAMHSFRGPTTQSSRHLREGSKHQDEKYSFEAVQYDHVVKPDTVSDNGEEEP